MAFTVVYVGKARQGRVNSLNSASLSNFSNPCAEGVVSSCLVPGSQVIKASWFIKRNIASRFLKNVLGSQSGAAIYEV